MTSITSDHSGISVSTKDGINILRFNRPGKKNAITAEMYATMAAALAEGEQRDDVSVHVLLGQPGIFTAGNDIQDFLATTIREPGPGSEAFSFLKGLVKAEKPLLAGVDGLAIGIGTTLLLHFDLVYATARSFFQTPFTNLGLVPEAASSLLAPRLMGHQRAFALLAMGENWSAQMAFDAGLVNQIIEPEKLENHTLEAGWILAAKPPLSIRTTRRLLRGNPEETLNRIDEEAAHFIRHLDSTEARQAFTAFLKR